MHHFGQRCIHLLMLAGKSPEDQDRLSVSGVTHGLYKLQKHVAGARPYGLGFCEENKALGGEFLAALLDAPTLCAIGVRTIFPVCALAQKAGPWMTVVALECAGV